ncbi:lipoprotein-releasing ABC transporter permease subunit [soil metagenome]
MFRPFAMFVGLRYTRAKRRNHFISFISFSSVVGIALGVAVLITVMSVMNGFDEVIHTRVFDMAQQVTVRSYTGTITDWQALEKRLENVPGVIKAAPFALGQGMLAHAGQVRPIASMGILPDQEASVSELPKKMVMGTLSNLKPGHFGMIVGRELAEGLGLVIGDKVTLVTPEATLTPIGLIPRFKPFTIVGVFHVGSGFGFDNLAYIHLQDAQKLLKLNNAVTGIRLKVNDLYAAPAISGVVAQQLPTDYSVGNWTQDYGALFSAISLEKRMMFLILFLIVAVAAFNLVSSLVMVVADKRADIAILRTLGATPRMIMATFMIQGTVLGVAGTIIGVIAGIVIAMHVTEIVSAIEGLFHVKLLSSNIYWVNYLPSKLLFADIWHIGVVALLMSLIATLYPAWSAAQTQPAEALRYE